MDATERDLRHLLDLLSLLPSTQGSYEESWDEFAEAIGHPDWRLYIEQNLNAFVSSVLEAFESGDAEALRRSGSKLASYLLLFFGGATDHPLRGRALEILSSWLGNGPDSLGRLWADDLSATAWRVYSSNPQQADLADGRPAGEKWGGLGKSRWDEALRKLR